MFLINLDERILVASSGASEFGGDPGLIQPPPHDPELTAYEQARIERSVDSVDTTDSVEFARQRGGARRVVDND